MGLGTNRDYITRNRAIDRRMREFEKRQKQYTSAGMSWGDSSKRAFEEVKALCIPGTKRLPKRLSDLGIE